MRTSEETERDRDLWQKRRVVGKILSNGDSDLVSNLLHPSCQLKTTKLPRYSISTLGHTHKQTRTPNTQGTKIPGVEAKRERKRETHAHNRHLRENEREKEEESACCTRVSPQNLDPIDCPSKFNQISHASTLSAEVHHSRVGEDKERERGGGGVGGENESLS